MPNFRRFYVPDAIYFVTSATHQRRPVFRSRRCMEALLESMRYTHKLHPFHMLAYALLWDHIHLLLRPLGESTISQIMYCLKRSTTFRVKALSGGTESVQLWQPRFWDHIIRDEEDLNRHLDYVHYNAVKHAYVTRPEDWRESSYCAWLARGYYEQGWGHEEPRDVAGLCFE